MQRLMTTKAQALTLLTLGATLMTAPAQTNQTTQAAAAPRRPPSARPNKRFTIIKNPFSWLNWGADFRVRNEYFNNALSLTSDPR